jgi:hypothetical protein
LLACLAASIALGNRLDQSTLPAVFFLQGAVAAAVE